MTTLAPSFLNGTSAFLQVMKTTITSSPKGNDAHLRVIIQSEKKMETSIFQTLKGS